MKKKSLFIILLLIVGFTILYSGLCPRLCPADQSGLDFVCSISFHSSAHIGAGFLTLFILFLMGLFLLKDNRFTPEGFVLLPYRPPRFHA